ncbi:MAG: S41 family peptidase [Candidatus Eisenbacteria bacterium]
MHAYVECQSVGIRCFLVTRLLLVSVVLGLVLVFLGADSAVCQQVMVRQGTSESIDQNTKAAIIDSVSKALNDVYVFPDVARKMEKQIRHNLKTKAYQNLTTYDDFANQLSADLFEIAKDKHLSVRYSPEESPFEVAARDSLTEDEEREIRERLAYMNFGFMRLERMPGNVGYLDLQGFNDARWGGETAVAAMNFLANCDAIIIDLRNNGGGSPSMIQLISSYFFDEPVHLNSFYIRDKDETKQFWSQAYVEGPRMTDVDLYVLTSSRTFSAAEEFTYNMKNLERATIVGETTGGGAHPVRFVRFADLKVSMSLPFGRAVNPITGTNWEGTGIEPHIEVPESEALATAHLDAMAKLAERATDEERKQDLKWAIATVTAGNNPVSLDPATMQKYAGVYGPRSIICEGGDLYYEREGRPRFKMIPMSEDTFMFDGIGYFRLKVETDDTGRPTAVVGIYKDGRTDRNERTGE